MRNPSRKKRFFSFILIKFLLVFLLFGILLVCISRAIQKDLTQAVADALQVGASAEELTAITDKASLNASLAVSVLIVYSFFGLFIFVVKWNRSLQRMEDHLKQIGTGNYPGETLQISGGDELGEMAEVINEMKQSLKEKERLRNELETARTIQAEMLPDAASVRLPDSCRIQGFMTPAREVGGDLYDFFLTDSSHLALVIADVSDKGAPAALFMATAKMCIKDNLMLRTTPAEVMKRVNNRLLEGNRSGLFVTAWVGELDLRTGRLQYASAGHPFPFVQRAGTSVFETLSSDTNLVLGGLPDFVYSQEETCLRPGDRLFLYTDGLDEARDPKGGFFGRARVKAYLEAHASDDIQDMISGIRKAVDDFAAGREQSDDLTLLMLDYAGGENHE